MDTTNEFDSYGRTQAEIDAILRSQDAGAAHSMRTFAAAYESRIDEAARLLAARERVRRRYGPAPATRVVAGLRLGLPPAWADAPPPPRPEPAPSAPRREPLPPPVSDLEAGARLMDAELARIVARLRQRLAAAIAGRRLSHQGMEAPEISA